MALTADAVINLGSTRTALSTIVGVSMLLGMALFAWLPPVAATTLVAACGVAVASGIGGPFPLALAVGAGLVAYTCSTALTVAYCVGASTLSLYAEWTAQGITSGGTLGILAIGLASLLIGVAARSGRVRERRLTADLDRASRERAAAIRTERDRIADELHNIIAHDITIVMLQARALHLIKNAEERNRSVQAITDAAAQAMTDIRRMLRVVQDDSTAANTELATAESITSRIAAVGEELRTAGIYVQVRVQDGPAVSPSINATLCHLLNEGTTNILKHAAGASNAEIALTVTSNDVALSIWNDGVPFQSPRSVNNPGYGLRRMLERVALLAGSLSSGPDNDGVGDGWTVRARLPRT